MSKEAKQLDLITEKAIRVMNYTQSSTDARYSGEGFDSGYHTITIRNETFKGQRNNQERLSQLNYDFKDKVVLDIGCNMGGILHELANDLKYGAGVDFDAKCINAANFIATVNKANNVKFFTFDLEEENIYRLWNFFPHEKIDVCFFLALSYWVSNWKEIIEFCAQISDNLVFETNAYPEELKQENISYLNRTYEQVTVLSTTSEDDSITKGRVLLWCSNTPFQFDNCIQFLKKTVKETKIRGIEPFASNGCQRKAYVIRGTYNDYFLGVGGQRNWADYTTSQFLRSRNASVVNTIIASEDDNGTPYIIREYIRSTTLAKSKYKAQNVKLSIRSTLKGIRSRATANNHLEHIVREAINEICSIHRIRVNGYGFIDSSSTVTDIVGSSKTWLNFLEFLVKNEGDFLRKEDIISKKEHIELSKNYQVYFGKYKELFRTSSYFLLGDIGWSNILVADGGKVSLTDLEFALIGDPAFEFSCMRDYTKKHIAYYMKEQQKWGFQFDAGTFEKRIKLYEPIKILFVSSYAAARNGRKKLAKSQFDSGVQKLEKLI